MPAAGANFILWFPTARCTLYHTSMEESHIHWLCNSYSAASPSYAVMLMPSYSLERLKAIRESSRWKSVWEGRVVDEWAVGCTFGECKIILDSVDLNGFVFDRFTTPLWVYPSPAHAISSGLITFNTLSLDLNIYEINLISLGHQRLWSLRVHYLSHWS